MLFVFKFTEMTVVFLCIIFIFKTDGDGGERVVGDVTVNGSHLFYQQSLCRVHSRYMFPSLCLELCHTVMLQTLPQQADGCSEHNQGFDRRKRE